jgi:antitoxin (DNA-binding transcriptional repressor) of toxin-antitoxin stability system
MLTCSVSHFKAPLTERLRRVQAGERPFITDHNRPVALVSPAHDPLVERPATRPFEVVEPKVSRGGDLSAWRLLDEEPGLR